MLHSNEKQIRELLLEGSFGLEKESLRVDAHGFFAHTPDPFSRETHIVRDFCENQVEINTPVVHSCQEAVDALEWYNRQIIRTLQALPEPEYLWPFSNPPYIRSEKDIPVAQYDGGEAAKTDYRNYLSDRYGRYKMTFSGIHFNYAFSEELLRAEYALRGETDYSRFKNNFYVALAEQAAAYGWLMVAVTAASPLLDSSYAAKNQTGTDLFNGMATSRCSELGYWNSFTPVFDYSGIEGYADSILQYVQDGLLKYPSELYYPIRLKPKGAYDLETLKKEGADHIELRMIDLNPLEESGIHPRDVRFAQLFLVWLAAKPREPLALKEQVQAVQNFKNAARFDLKTVKIVVPNGEVYSVATAAIRVLERMEEFYRDFPEEIQDVLQFEKAKFLDPENRYAWKIRAQFSGGFVEKGMQLVRQRQQNIQAERQDSPALCV